MANNGWNPARRNRNIGTAKQGRGQNNKLVIPKAWPDDRIFYEVLKDPVVLYRMIGNNEVTFLVEPTTSGCVYPCTVEDITAVLKLLPEKHLDGLELFILRQPTSRQRILHSVWGRFIYYARPGEHAGTAICIESQDLSKKMKWRKSLAPDDARELDRLRSDGHEVLTDRRSYEIISTPESFRNTVLFRTVLHEIGHYVHWLQNVIWPAGQADDSNDFERLNDAFRSKPSKEREDFAHRYADELSKELKRKELIPFPMIVPADSMQAEGLDPSWFPYGGNYC